MVSVVIFKKVSVIIDFATEVRKPAFLNGVLIIN